MVRVTYQHRRRAPTMTWRRWTVGFVPYPSSGSSAAFSQGITGQVLAMRLALPHIPNDGAWSRALSLEACVYPAGNQARTREPATVSACTPVRKRPRIDLNTAWPSSLPAAGCASPGERMRTAAAWPTCQLLAQSAVLQVHSVNMLLAPAAGVVMEEEGGEDEAWCQERGLLDQGTCSEVAKHCNERKLAAKAVQASALTCIYLRVKFSTPPALYRASAKSESCPSLSRLCVCECAPVFPSAWQIEVVFLPGSPPHP